MSLKEPGFIVNDVRMGIPSIDKLSQPIQDWYVVLEEMAEYAEENGGLKPSDYAAGSDWAKALGQIVRRHGPNVYSIKYLHPDFCDSLMDELNCMAYAVNEDEPEEARIPEVVLQHRSPAMFEALRSLYHGAGLNLCKILFGLDAVYCASIQAAQYTIDNTPHGCWHTDRDSDVTLVVALTDEHVGGGTTVYQGPFAEPVTVPQLPKGHAMFFLGRTNQHMGLPVTEGTRNLLVHWYQIEGSFA
jgi:hypothetical protein